MKTHAHIMPVATSDFVTKKNHGEFMADRIDRLAKWVGRTRWPGTFQMWVVEDLQSAVKYVHDGRWNDAHEMLVGALLGIRFTVDHVVGAEHHLEDITTLETWIHTIKSDIQKLIP
jgi:hypothetical protein